MELEEAFGQVIRRLRQERGWSQEQLGFEAGVDRNYISLIELGKNSPSLKMLSRLSAAFDVAPSDLLLAAEARTRKRSRPSST